MRFPSRVFLFCLALIAVTAFTHIQREMGVFAPAPPVSVPAVSGDENAAASWTVNRQPTVLAPQAADAGDLPPGTPADSGQDAPHDSPRISTANSSLQLLGDKLLPSATERALEPSPVIPIPELEFPRMDNF